MNHGFVTSGVNVRPRKPRYESCPPSGLRTSGGGWVLPAGRPRHRSEHRRLRERVEGVSLATALEQARARMYAAQDRVSALVAEGIDKRSKSFRDAAAASRQARAAWLELNGGVEARSVEVSLGSSSGKVKPLD